MFLICGAIFAQPSPSTQTALKSLQNAIAYRQDFIIRQQNSYLTAQEYGHYEMYKYSWGLRQKTIERDQIEIDMRVLKYYEVYSMRLTDDLLAGRITKSQLVNYNNSAMPQYLYDRLADSKEKIYPASSETCQH